MWEESELAQQGLSVWIWTHSSSCCSACHQLCLTTLTLVGEDSVVKQLCWVSGKGMGPELFLLLLLFRVGWGQEQGGGGGRGLSSSSRDGVSADKEPDVWQTVLCEMMDWLAPFQASQGSGCSEPTWLHEKQHNTWLSASGFPQTKTTPCWQSRYKLRAHRLTLCLWSVVYYELQVYKPKYN